MLKGMKTYIVVIVGVLVNGAYAMGYIPEASIGLVNTVLGFLGLAALRAGVK
jgi:hypothetical protein